MSIFVSSRRALSFSRHAPWRVVALAVGWGMGSVRAADSEAAPAVDDLLEAGRQLWDEYAPPEVKANYDFPSPEAVESYLAALQRALAEGSWEELAAYAVDAGAALVVLRQFEGGDELADWLEPRLDFVTAAGVLHVPPQPPQPPQPPPARATPRVARVARATSPLERPYWDHVTVGRHPPARAAALVPRLKRIFADEGVPPAWVWMAEVESSMNPQARSPVGAKGLFQFMPATAERFGLSKAWPDERTHPEKSARAAAQYLRFLHDRFGSWPLALAAYNAGEGRVGRALQRTGTKSFAEVAPHLPSETRLYVPKVMATVAAREAVADPASLPAPTAVR